MVDHRADEDGDFRIFVTDDDERERFSWSRVREQVSEWFQRRETPATAGRRTFARPVDPTPSPLIDWLSRNRLPVVLTVLWLMALGAYGFGYYQRLEAEAGDRMLPTLELLFFAFAVAGPIAMVWIVVMMLERSERLTEALIGQSESALALATTISTLNDSVDALNIGTVERLEKATAAVERDTTASLRQLLTTMDGIAQKVDTAILDSVITLDKSNRERQRKIEEAIATERSAFADRLDSDAQRLATAIETGAAATQKQMESAVQRAIREQKTRLDETNKRIEQALSALTVEVAQSLDARGKMLDEGLRQQQESLVEAAKLTQATIQNDIIHPVGAIRQTLDQTARTITANPPATADQLAALLGTTAEALVRPEREALAQSLEKLATLEQTARTLLVQLDRTSRLNNVIAREDTAATDDRGAAALATDSGQDLLFADLPQAAERNALNWTAVVRVMDFAEPRPGTRHVMQAAAADPDVAALLAAEDVLEAELAEDGIYLEDIRPEHSAPSLWARFARGERGAEIAPLSGLEDDIASALVRARLRGAPTFHGKALKFIDAYITLLHRAVDEIGTDQRLVEMAETRTGRAFLLLADTLEIFERPLHSADDPSA